jgi:hypothetical protein
VDALVCAPDRMPPVDAERNRGTMVPVVAALAAVHIAEGDVLAWTREPALAARLLQQPSDLTVVAVATAAGPVWALLRRSPGD